MIRYRLFGLVLYLIQLKFHFAVPILNVPNQITLLRILFIPLFVYFLLGTSLPGGKWIALTLFVILALSDAVDGYLARHLKQTSSFGQLIDPIADKLLVFSAYLSFIELGKLPSFIIFIILARDFLVMGIRAWAAKKGEIIPADSLGKWKTFAQLTAIGFLIADMPLQYLIFYLSVLLTLLSGWHYFKKTNLELE